MSEPLPIAYDTETTGLDIHRGSEMFAYSTCSYEGETLVRRLDGKGGYNSAEARQKLDSIWADPNIPIVMHNAKFDLTVTENYLNMPLAGSQRIHDTYIESHLIMNNHPSRKLKALAWELAGVPVDDEDKVVDSISGEENYSMVPVELMDLYQERDAVRTMLLHRFFYPRIKSNFKYIDIYRNELDLVPVTMAMERRGFMVNSKKCLALAGKMDSMLTGVLDELEVLCGRRVKPSKHDDLYWLLFDFANLPVLEKTPTGLPKTSKEVLQELQRRCFSPALELVMKFRAYQRGGTILRSYVELADADSVIHPSINTCRAITGRQSCSRPNLQNVEKTGVLLNPYPVPARLVFMPRPGYVNFHVDYAGIEFRLLVFYSREPIMLELIRANGDPHDWTATNILFKEKYRNCADPKLKKALRYMAKTVNFTILYGGGADVVARALGLDLAEGTNRLMVYRSVLPKMSGLSRTISSQVRKQGYITTAFGRTLKLPRNQAYMGTNYLIQGTAAEILKRAQVRVHNFLEKSTGGEAGIIMPIHDELIIEYPRNMLGDAPPILKGIREVMIDFGDVFDLPLEVEFEVATLDWEHKVKYNLEGL